MLFPPNPRHVSSPSDGALALSGGGLVAARSALPSRSWLGSLALHGLVLIAAVYVNLPKPMTAPVLAPAVMVQFAAMPVPEVVSAPAPAQHIAPPPEPMPPEPAVTEPAAIEPVVNEPPPILTRQALAEEAVPPPAKPKPPTKLERVAKPAAAKPERPKPRPVETKPIETKPVESKLEPAAVPAETALSSPAAEPPAAMPAPVSLPAPAPAPALAASPEAAELPMSEPPVLHQARFRRPPTPPAYPPRSRALEQEGVSVVRALIDPDGVSREVRLWRSSGYQMLDQAALAAVRGWAFEAARFGGRPVLAWVEIPIRFELR